MKVKMLKTVRGSPNGFDINEYKSGEIYNLPKELADIFIHEGWAELIEEKIEEKTIDIFEKKVVEVKEKQIIKKRNKK